MGEGLGQTFFEMRENMILQFPGFSHQPRCYGDKRGVPPQDLQRVDHAPSGKRVGSQQRNGIEQSQYGIGTV